MTNNDYSSKSILITGGLGFIGSNLAERLVDLGGEVTLLDCSLPGSGANLHNISEFRDSVSLVEGDIRDRRVVDSVVVGKDVVFNLGAQVDHKLAMRDPALDADINCRGHLNVLEACRTLAPNSHVIFPGSRMPYGRLKPEDLPVKETHPLSPLDMYSIHKVTGEAYMRMYHDQHGLDTTVLRLTNPFGPRAQVTNPAYCVVNWMVRQAMEGKPLKIFGDGVQRRDFVYIGDVVDAMVIAGLHPSAKGETFNIGSGVATPFRDMVHIISEQNGDNPVECVEWPANYKAVETGDFAADVSKARRVLGWSAKTSLQEGLEITRKFYESNRSHYFI